MGVLGGRETWPYWHVNESKDESLTGKENHNVLNRKGSEGWELVHLWERDRIEFYIYFKRPLP